MVRIVKNIFFVLIFNFFFKILAINGTETLGESGWAKKTQKCATILRKYLMWCSITPGLLEHFHFFSFFLAHPC